MKKFIYISGIVIINLFVVGALFKINHYPGASVMITLGLGLFCLAFMPLAFYQSYKGNGGKNKSIYISGAIVVFITFLGALFKIQHWPGAGIFLIVGIPLPFLYFLPLYIYQHNKMKEKSSINFLGVMFLMVYIAVFSAILALNVSRDILEAFNTGENDVAKTNEIYSIKNKAVYARIEKAGTAYDVKKYSLLESRSEAIYTEINNIRTELVKAVENSDSKAIEAGNKINTKAIIGKDESGKTIGIMRGTDGVSGKAADLKKLIVDYKTYLKTFTEKNKESEITIAALLNTDNITDSISGDPNGLSWENRNFPNGAYLISVLTSLSCIETNVRMAEAEALEIW